MANTKEKILFACEELAIRKGRGFYHLSIDELAKLAGVSKRTVYRYFASKDELVEATLDKVMGQMMAKNMELIKSGKDLKIIMAAIVKNVSTLINQQLLEDVYNFSPLLWQKIDKIRQNNIDKLLNHIFANSEVKMSWRVNPKIFKASLFAAMTEVLNPKFILESGLSFEETVNNFLEMFLFGAVEHMPYLGIK